MPTYRKLDQDMPSFAMIIREAGAEPIIVDNVLVAIELGQLRIAATKAVGLDGFLREHDARPLTPLGE